MLDQTLEIKLAKGRTPMLILPPDVQAPDGLDAHVIRLDASGAHVDDHEMGEHWRSAGGWHVRATRDEQSMVSERTDWGAPELEIHDDRGRISRIPLALDDGVKLTIGRTESESDVVISDAHVSGRHVLILVKNGRHYVRDLGSRHGTTVNGEPLTGIVALDHGDEIRAGRTKIRYSFYLGSLRSDQEPAPQDTPQPPASTPAPTAKKKPRKLLGDVLLFASLFVLVLVPLGLAAWRTGALPGLLYGP